MGRSSGVNLHLKITSNGFIKSLSLQHSQGTSSKQFQEAPMANSNAFVEGCSCFRDHSVNTQKFVTVINDDGDLRNDMGAGGTH